MTPNGLIANLSGPYEGKRHESGIFRESNLVHDLSRQMNFPNGVPCCLYGDAAYPSRASHCSFVSGIPEYCLGSSIVL